MKKMIIDDIIQVNDIPIPIILYKFFIEAACPFCGKTIVKQKRKPNEEPQLTGIYAVAVSSVSRHMYEDGCKTPEFDLVIKKVKVDYSFESAQEVCKEMGISLTKQEGQDGMRM